MALLERFFPDIYVKSVFELPLEDLKKLGIRGLVFDIDNTVAPFDVAEPDEEIVELFAFLRKEGFKSTTESIFSLILIPPQFRVKGIAKAVAQ